MDTYDKTLVGLNIAKYRLRANLNQVQLSEILGIKSDTLSQYERGVKSTGIVTLCKIADALNITIDHLLEGNTDYSVSDNKLTEFKTYLLKLDKRKKKDLYDILNCIIENYYNN